MKPPKFYNKDGSLTSYAYACGYVTREESKESKMELYKEHCVYHIRFYNSMGKRLWETADTLTEARKLYRKMKRENFK